MNKQELKNIIGEAKVILDIGSYDGKDARELHELFGCDVHCFEPNEEVFIKSDGLVYYPVAIMGQDGKATFFKSDHPQSSSVFTPWNHLNVWSEISFDMPDLKTSMSLDSWYSGNKIRTVDLIHADVNGSEKELIIGGKMVLQNTRFLYIEVSDKELYAGQPKINEVIAMLPDFKVIGLYDFGENFGNILFKNTKL